MSSSAPKGGIASFVNLMGFAVTGEQGSRVTSSESLVFNSSTTLLTPASILSISSGERVDITSSNVSNSSDEPQRPWPKREREETGDLLVLSGSRGGLSSRGFETSRGRRRGDFHHGRGRGGGGRGEDFHHGRGRGGEGRGEDFHHGRGKGGGGRGRGGGGGGGGEGGALIILPSMRGNPWAELERFHGLPPAVIISSSVEEKSEI